MALTGNASFTPVGGKSYLLQAELIGNPVFNPPDSCFIGAQVYVNGITVTFVNLFSNEPEPGFDSSFPEGSGTTSLLTQTGAQRSRPRYSATPCGAGTSLDKLRITVTELG